MTTRNVYFFVFDGLSDWEAAYAIAGINNPQFQHKPGTLGVRTVAAQAGSVTTVGGLRIQPDLTLADLSVKEDELLILPGGTQWDEGKNMEAVEAAKAALAANGAVAAICGATVGLARGGLLDDVQHTSNSRDYLKATDYQGAALYQDDLAVTDGRIITAGATSPVDFALHIFKYLDVYSNEVLESWYGLFKTGNPEFYAALMQAKT